MQPRVATADYDAVPPVVRPEGEPSFPPRISWGAVFAGGVAAVGLGAMLNMLGLAIGATTLDPATPGESPSAETFALVAGGWLLLANLVALLGGGWVAARLSGTADRTDGALHGFAVWAVAFLLSILLVGNIVAGTAGTAARGASALIGGTAQGLGQAAQAIAPQAADALDPEGLTARLERMLRSEGAPEEMNSDQRQSEIARLIAERVRQGGEATGQDRLPALLSAEFGIPEQQVEARIGELEARARELATEVERQARSAAAAAANATATGAYWVFAAMLLGAAAAVVGGAIGTRRLVVPSPGQM